MKKKSRHIVVFYAMKPRKGAPTNQKGWMNDDRNVQWDENFKMTVGIRNKDLTEAQVILNIDDRKIVKNWKASEGENDYDTLYSYYAKNYDKYIKDFIRASEKLR